MLHSYTIQIINTLNLKKNKNKTIFFSLLYNYIKFINKETYSQYQLKLYEERKKASVSSGRWGERNDRKRDDAALANNTTRFVSPRRCNHACRHRSYLERLRVSLLLCYALLCLICSQEVTGRLGGGYRVQPDDDVGRKEECLLPGVIRERGHAHCDIKAGKKLNFVSGATMLPLKS